ncbi:MAG TPA: ATP-binding cassette domain-containing protein [Bacteroidia bacterium]
MSEKILKALMRLFAIIAKADANPAEARGIIQSFLKLQLNNEQVIEYLGIYDDFLKQQDEGAEGEKKKRRLAVNSVKVIVICEQINEELTQKQKFIVLLNLIAFVSYKDSISELEMEFISIVSDSFNIPASEFNQCLELATKASIKELNDSPLFLNINSSPLSFGEGKGERLLHSDGLNGDIIVLKINSISTYLFRYYGTAELLLNGQAISPGKIYILSQGSSIRSSKVLPIYYSDIAGCFMQDTSESKWVFDVRNITYKFKSGKNGLYPLSFTETSGKLIGIMGGSGAGKSTLLNILNGCNEPTGGQILINGHDLYKEKKALEGVIGYVPQDDLLMEDLTVYQNLFYSTKLCFAGSDDAKINELVTNTLNDLGLYETKDLKVGSPLEKTISGGQRKRLNIALELIREPSVMFVDEPTSGLSSRDSENAMDLLKELALKGKLVFVVIHQPSSDIFKMFDKLLILDNGGYPIYYGNPVEAVVYFKTKMTQVNANESECVACGNVNPEQIFNIIESKVLDENGNQTRTRRVSPKEWNDFYSLTPTLSKGEGDVTKQEVKNSFKKPNFLEQFKVFTTRDVLSKLSNTQYLLINMLEAPVLALILASLTRYYKSGGEYTFADNKNIPAYLFMCILVALFIGLTVSAEEIIRDRKILKRESFLNLSRGSYLLSKIFILFVISAIQTICFVLIGNYILGIQGMYFSYWMVLFTTSCFANMLGLNISSTFNSAVTIYILIPFLLIPQILLSGVLVKFEELNPTISSVAVVPAWGDAMVSRWAFEALAVNQYVNNEYEKNIYHLDKEINNAMLKKIYWCAQMNTLAEDKASPEDKAILMREIQKEEHLTPKRGEVEVKDYISSVKKHYSQKYDAAQKELDNWLSAYQTTDAKKKEYEVLLNANQNRKIEDLVKNLSTDLDPLIKENGELVATTNPIFRDAPDTRFIRSHFFAPRKSVFGTMMDTYWVNLLVIWAMSLLMWVTLYFDALKKLLDFLTSISSSFKRLF